MTIGGGVYKFPKLRDVIYGRPLRDLIKKFGQNVINFYVNGIFCIESSDLLLIKRRPDGGNPIK